MGHESPIEPWSPNLTEVSALLISERTGFVANEAHLDIGVCTRVVVRISLKPIRIGHFPRRGAMTTSPTRAIAPTPQKTALVVASGGDIDELLMSVLVAEGWNMQHVVDNQDALSLARTEPFDLIITGRKTRGPEDIDFLRKIRSARPHLRLIILTDQWTPGDIIAAMREGAFSYFVAPFDASALAEMVRAAMAQPCWDDGIEVLSATPKWFASTARCDLLTADRLVQFLHGFGRHFPG